MPMRENENRWYELTLLAAKEQDYKKFMNLVMEIHRLIKEKELRLAAEIEKDQKTTR